MENFEIPQEPTKPETIKPLVVEKEVVLPPTESAEERKERESREYEQSLVIENPEFVGMNFDQDCFVDARNFWSQEKYLQYIQERDGNIPEEVRSLVGTDKAEKIILGNKEKETRKMTEFDEYLSGFDGKLQHVRIHPAGECSPLTPSQAVEIKNDGTFDVAISPEFIDQIKKVEKQTDDITLVVQFYDHRRGKERSSDVPETPEQTEQYVALCQKIIENTGEGVQLEIGNETNISRNTAIMFADKLQHASHVNSSEYGKFFFDVAERIKEKNPTTKLSVAGVACFDPTYLREVLGEIKQLQEENKIEIPLVDTISFHPYRDKPEGGAIEVKNGKFTISQLDYNGQLEEMQKIALEFGVKLNVGEINFLYSDPEQERKLEQAISLTAEKKVESFIYPAVNVH
jgi:hypothetical protein